MRGSPALPDRWTRIRRGKRDVWALELEGRFEHQNDTGGNLHRTLNAVGAVVNLYF
jgi:hypothetical protein